MAENELTITGELEDFTIPDLNLPSLIELRDSVMDLEDVPDKAAIVLSLTALGYSTRRISEILKIKQPSVVYYLDRYDPQRKCVISNNDKRLITTQMMMSTAIEALANITHEKLASSTAKDLSGIASQCAATVEKLNLSKQIGDAVSTSRVNSMLDALDVVEEG